MHLIYKNAIGRHFKTANILCKNVCVMIHKRNSHIYREGIHCGVAVAANKYEDGDDAAGGLIIFMVPKIVATLFPSFS